ncbi:transposase, partial [Escherichia coli]|uniref:transposase n=1 Tax=Escherichia coli TaxID=562 RepID=UPI00112F487C
MKSLTAVRKKSPNYPLTAVRKKSPNYPVEFKIKMVELSHRPEISVAQLAREHGIND